MAVGLNLELCDATYDRCAAVVGMGLQVAGCFETSFLALWM